MLLLYAAFSVLVDTVERSKISAFFLKKVAIFRHFSGRFVIFNIEVNKLEIRKISPILHHENSFFCT